MKIFKYLKYYFEPNDKFVRQLALDACRRYFKPLRSIDPYPRVIDYQRRLEETVRFQRAFADAYRHEYAKRKICS
jgi:hypothetical protein